MSAATVPAMAADADKTTFVAAADSFLDIFCVDQAPAADAAPDPAAGAAAGPARTDGEDATRPRSKAAALASELLAAFRGKGAPNLQRALRWGTGVLVLVAVAAWSLYRIGAPERDAETLLNKGAYAQAAAAAGDGLARDPGNARLKAIGTAAALKANLPAWMALLKARQFNRAATLVAAMRLQARHNADLDAAAGRTRMDHPARGIRRRTRRCAGADRQSGRQRPHPADPQGMGRPERDAPARLRHHRVVRAAIPRRLRRRRQRYPQTGAGQKRGTP